MIRYALKCDNGHSFDSWFHSGAAFSDLLARGLVTCPDCGTADVHKAIMAPAIAKPVVSPAPKPAPESAPVAHTQPAAPPTRHDDPAAAQGDAAEALRALRAHVEATAEYMGDKFADEARAMYLGDTPSRPIYGEARPEDARLLIEEGVPVLPLPFIPRAKTN